nr:zinc finger, CCHC-type [Tanacetum cinerariifolium]
GLWEAIEPKENTQVDDNKDKATTAFLYQALTEDVILQVAGCKMAKELWESLKKRHVGEERVQQAWLQSFMIGFQTLQMKEDDTMDAFTAKLNGYATKATELGKTLDESLLVRKLLDSTPDRFIQIVASIKQTNDLDDITLDEIVRKLKAFKERIKLRKEGQVESQDNLLFAHGEHSRKGTRFSKRGGRSNFSRGNWQRKVYKLTKALYGLRQAPRAWNVKLDQTLKSLDLKKCNLEQAVYIKRSKTSTLIVGVYVDDLIITGTPRKEIDLFKSQMEDKFEMSDLGLLAYYLGIEVTQTGGEITIRQTGYINKIFKETSTMESNDTKIPMISVLSWSRRKMETQLTQLITEV